VSHTVCTHILNVKKFAYSINFPHSTREHTTNNSSFVMVQTARLHRQVFCVDAAETEMGRCVGNDRRGGEMRV
jgi:hypothetical protein